jgi:hypothetical protein
LASLPAYIWYVTNKHTLADLVWDQIFWNVQECGQLSVDEVSTCIIGGLSYTTSVMLLALGACTIVMVLLYLKVWHLGRAWKIKEHVLHDKLWKAEVMRAQFSNAFGRLCNQSEEVNLLIRLQRRRVWWKLSWHEKLLSFLELRYERFTLGRDNGKARQVHGDLDLLFRQASLVCIFLVLACKIVCVNVCVCVCVCLLCLLTVFGGFCVEGQEHQNCFCMVVWHDLLVPNCVSVCVCTCVCMYRCVYMSACVWVRVRNAHANVNVCLKMWLLRMYACVYMCVLVHVNLHAYTQTDQRTFPGHHQRHYTHASGPTGYMWSIWMQHPVQQDTIDPGTNKKTGPGTAETCPVVQAGPCVPHRFDPVHCFGCWPGWGWGFYCWFTWQIPRGGQGVWWNGRKSVERKSELCDS